MAAAIVLGGAAAAQTPQQTPALTAEAFGALPEFQDVALAPDGTKLAMARTAPDATSVIDVFDLSSNQRIRTAGAGDALIRSVGWFSDTQVSFVISRAVDTNSATAVIRFRGNPDKIEYFRGGVLDIYTGESRILSTRENFHPLDWGGYAVGPYADDPDHILFIGRSPPPERNTSTSRVDAMDFGMVMLRVTRINLRTGGRSELRIPGMDRFTDRIFLDPAGQIRAREDLNDETNRWELYVYDGDQERLLMSDPDSGVDPPIGVAGLLADGRLAAFDTQEDGFSRMIAISPADGSTETIWAPEGFDVEASIRDPWTRTVIGAVWIETEAKQHFFEPALNEALAGASTAMPGAAVRLVSWSRDRSRPVRFVELDGDDHYLSRSATRTAMLREIEQFLAEHLPAE